MGRYEDLIAAVREGDATALDALETEFGGSALREKAESAGALQEKYDKGLPLMRKAVFADLVEQLDDDHKGSGISVAGSTARPRDSTRCRPTRRSGSRCARATASSAAAAPIMRLAVLRMPCRQACSIASLTEIDAPKSSPVTIRRFRSRAPWP